MSSFSIMYKKAFKKILTPHGYSLWKSVFYREVDESVCFFVRAKKVWPLKIPGAFEIFIDTAPYCADLKSNEYDPQENGIKLFDILKIITPEILTEERVKEYRETRNTANTEETMFNSINNCCDDMENMILPYVHKFEDLEYYYKEKIKIYELDSKKGDVYINYFLYGLSLKLHKYENALPYVEHQLKWHDDVIQHKKSDIEELGSGNIDHFIQARMKKDKNFFEEYIIAIETDIVRSEKEMIKFKTIKNALLSKDSAFLDRLVEETEKDSLDYIRQLLKTSTG